MKYILLLIGTVFFVNGSVLFAISNVNSGLVGTVLIGIFFLFWGVFYKRIKAVTQKGFLKALKILVVAAICFEAVLVISVAVVGEIDTVTYDEDALIVLGAGLRGERITIPLKLRLDKALYYHAKNPEALIIVSGGQGYGEDITEAFAMRKYLVENGVPENLVIEEPEATSTSENMFFSGQILQKYYEKEIKEMPIAFVTNNFHVFRSERLAAMAGFENVTHIHTSLQWYNYIPCYIRETLAIFKMWLLKY